MKKTLHCILLFATASWLQTSTHALVFAAQHEHGPGTSHEGQHAMTTKGEQVLKVGKMGEMQFSHKTRVGNITLKPGKYQFQHRVEGLDHFIRFTELTKATPAGYLPRDHPQPIGQPGEVKCRVEPLNKKIDRTAVYSERENGGYRITKIEVLGENAAHLLVPME